MGDKVYVVVKNTTSGFSVGTICKKIGDFDRFSRFCFIGGPNFKVGTAMFHPMSDVEEFVPAPIEDFL